MSGEEIIVVETLKDLEKKLNIKPRSMTRAERKAFRAAGLDLTFFEVPDDISTAESRVKFAEKQEQMVDWILENIYGDADVNWDNVSYGVQVQLAMATYQLTYGQDPKVLKNS